MKTLSRLASIVFATTTSCVIAAENKQESSSDVNNWDVSGYLMLDYDQYDSLFLEHSDESDEDFELRRARLSIKSTFADDWKTKLQLSYDDDEFDVKDAYIRYDGWNAIDLTIGQQKEPFGLEKLTSSRNLLMIERSMASEAFAPGRSPGISFSGGEKRWNWQLGYFIPDEEESAITGRVSWQPWKKKNNFLHLGLAFSERELDAQEFRINESLEVHTSDSLLEGDNLVIDNQSLAGVEALWQVGGFSITSEWQTLLVTDTTSQQYEYEGGYLQLGYRFGGTGRKYKNGVPKGLKNLSQSGDWEVTFRASELHLNDEDESAETLSLGVNYYLNNDLKLMGNYLKGTTFEGGAEQETGNAVSLRLQYSF